MASGLEKYCPCHRAQDSLIDCSFPLTTQLELLKFTQQNKFLSYFYNPKAQERSGWVGNSIRVPVHYKMRQETDSVHDLPKPP